MAWIQLNHKRLVKKRLFRFTWLHFVFEVIFGTISIVPIKTLQRSQTLSKIHTSLYILKIYISSLGNPASLLKSIPKRLKADPQKVF